MTTFQQRYRQWQIQWFHSELFSELFVKIMNRCATPIYQWAYDLMENDLRESTTVCDVGCGNGIMASVILKEVPYLKFTLVDRSESQIKKGSYLFKTMEQPPITLTALAENLPLSDQSFDFVLSTGSINLWDKPLDGMQECWRLLKPGGVLWIFDQRPCVSLSLAWDALIRKRVFGLGIPGYLPEEVLDFSEHLSLPEPERYDNESLYGFRWVKPNSSI